MFAHPLTTNFISVLITARRLKDVRKVRILPLFYDNNFTRFIPTNVKRNILSYRQFLRGIKSRYDEPFAEPRHQGFLSLSPSLAHTRTNLHAVKRTNISANTHKVKLTKYLKRGQNQANEKKNMHTNTVCAHPLSLPHLPYAQVARTCMYIHTIRHTHAHSLILPPPSLPPTPPLPTKVKAVW